jgi:hypothetical protein
LRARPSILAAPRQGLCPAPAARYTGAATAPPCT